MTPEQQKQQVVTALRTLSAVKQTLGAMASTVEVISRQLRALLEAQVVS